MPHATAVLEACGSFCGTVEARRSPLPPRHKKQLALGRGASSRGPLIRQGNGRAASDSDASGMGNGCRVSERIPFGTTNCLNSRAAGTSTKRRSGAEASQRMAPHPVMPLAVPLPPPMTVCCPWGPDRGPASVPPNHCKPLHWRRPAVHEGKAPRYSGCRRFGTEMASLP